MPAAHPLRVMVVDDHLGIRLGIERLVDAESPHLHCVGVAASADEALQQVRSLQPDIVVLDVDLAGEDGLALIPLLRRDAPCQVVVLTSLLDPRVAELAQRWGAHGLVHKAAPAGELLACITAAGQARRAHALADPANAGSAMSCAARTNHPCTTGK